VECQVKPLCLVLFVCRSYETKPDFAGPPWDVFLAKTCVSTSNGALEDRTVQLPVPVTLLLRGLRCSFIQVLDVSIILYDNTRNSQESSVRSPDSDYGCVCLIEVLYRLYYTTVLYHPILNYVFYCIIGFPFRVKGL